MTSRIPEKTCLYIIAFLNYQVLASLCQADHALFSILRNRTSNGNNVNEIIYLNETVSPPVDQRPIILLWYPQFKGQVWNNFTKFELKSGCILTSDRRLLSKAKAVVIQWGRARDSGSFPGKYSDQKWIWLSREPPPHHFKSSDLGGFHRYIDCWASYLRDSDFVFDHGRFIRSSGNETRKSKRVSLASKRKSVAWMVSDCGTCGGRDDYAKELGKYIDLDIYGFCGNLNCSDFAAYEDEHCWRKMGQEYKFYLSFENSICKDYFTEKLINIMSYDIVPIVFGGADYWDILPNNSFIDALVFPSPRRLAEFLSEVAQDEDRYNSYFEWKSHFEVIRRGFKEGFEDICAALKANQLEFCNRSDQDLVNWWYNESQCKHWDPILGLTNSQFNPTAHLPYGCLGRRKSSRGILI